MRALMKLAAMLVTANLGLATVAIVGTAGVSGCGAAKKDEEQPKDFTVGEWAHRRIEEILEATEAENYAEAEEVLQDMKERETLKPYERAVMWKLYANLYIATEQLPKAADAIDKALSLDALPKAEAVSLRFNLGSLYINLDQPDRAVALFEEWLRTAENPTPDALVVIAKAYYAAGTYDRSLAFVLKAMQQFDEPPEEALNLAMNARVMLAEKAVELKKPKIAQAHYQKIAELLKLLVTRFPKKEYWKQLSNVYSQLQNNKKSVAVMELAYRQEMLVEHDEILNLARLYIDQGMPLKGAEIIQKEMKKERIEENAEALELLSAAYMHARETERALRVLNRACKVAKTGDCWVRMGRLYISQEDWKDAVRSIRRGLRKGDLESPVAAHTFLGIAHYNAGNNGEARRAFVQARRVLRRQMRSKKKKAEKHLQKQIGEYLALLGS